MASHYEIMSLEPFNSSERHLMAKFRNLALCGEMSASVRLDSPPNAISLTSLFMLSLHTLV